MIEGNFKNGVYLGAGWMSARCCKLLDKGKDPRKMSMPELIEPMDKELKLTEKYFKQGEKDEEIS